MHPSEGGEWAPTVPSGSVPPSRGGGTGGLPHGPPGCDLWKARAGVYLCVSTGLGAPPWSTVKDERGMDAGCWLSGPNSGAQSPPEPPSSPNSRSHPRLWARRGVTATLSPNGAADGAADVQGLPA